MRYLGRFIIGLLLTITVFGLPFRALAIPNETMSDAPRYAEWGLTHAEEQAKFGLVGSIFTYLVNLASFAADRLAYDAAVQIASGGPAEDPLYDGRPVDVFFKQYGAAVAGEAIGLLQEDLEDAADVSQVAALLSNFNLCAPDANVILAINLGIKSAFERPEPKCDIRQVQTNWKGYLADMAGTNDDPGTKNQKILTRLAEMYNPHTNEFAVGLTIYSDVFNRVLEESALQTQAHVNASGFKGVANFITGNIETPAEVINEEWMGANARVKDLPFQTQAVLLSNTDALLQIGIHAGSVFTNTLLSELTQKLFDGFFTFDTEFPDPFADIETIASSSASSARDQFRSLLSTTPLEITNYTILGEFSSCPSGSRGLYNCVLNNSFASAIARADAGAPMTIEEALEEGLLNGGWPLIPSEDRARNQDPYCYTYGFCHTNLVKLRKARIIPVGWELAAESASNDANSPVTLQEVVNGFDDCNSQGLPDDNHPWCKLIDPAWVLKYPEQQCKALVYGQLLETSAAADRQQECVDMPSCIAEGDDGTCVGGFGYCVEEENTWRFRGESCAEQFASCLTFEGEDKTVSYLQNTLDFAGCNEQNAGCLWYATEQADPEGDGTFDWQPIPDIAAADADPEAYQSRIYLTDAVEECSGDAGGCRELVERNDALRLNALMNPSFEDDGNGDGRPDGWLLTNASGTVIDSSAQFSRSGQKGVQTGTGNFIYQPSITFSQGRFYTLSYYAKQNASNGGIARAILAFEADNASLDIDLRGTSIVGPCVIGNSNDANNGNGQHDLLALSATPSGSEFERFSCTFTVPSLSDASAQISAFVNLTGDAFIDDVQLEQGANASEYHIGYSAAALSTITVKVPPAYLGCEGDADDPEECAGYAQVCSENDVGCTLYSPENGDPAVSGVVTELDVCPASCVGYDTFKQEPTLYEPDGVFPVYFIPETGQECSEEEVGCDEFTNLTNEQKEYYTYLRACVTPTQAAANINSDQAATFYTWEGSDLEGYQLRTWNLLESNLGATPLTYAESSEQDLTPHLAPCSLWEATADGVICKDQTDTDGDLVKDWETQFCDEHDDIFTNPDCREFYDTNGGIHYRLWSKTVSVDAACTAYRKTEAAGLDSVAQASNCTESGGFWDASLGSCRYYGLSEESVACPASANGCRSYTGGRSRNSRVVLEDLLESGTVSLWDTPDAADVTLSNESLATGGHSLAATDTFSSFLYDNGSACAAGDCAGAAQSLGGTCTVTVGDQFCGTLEDELFAGKTYTLSFWAKGTGTLSAGFDLNADPNGPVIDVSFGNVQMTSGWQQFTLGPLDMSRAAYPAFGSGTTLVFDPQALTYIDNIVLREGEDRITVIKNSWVTPAECDQSPTGAPSPQYHLGCQEYSTQDNETAYLKSFSRLCDENKVGCEDFFMTQESGSPYAEVYNATCATPSGAPVASATACHYRVNAGVFDTASEYLCTIGVGFSSCEFNMNWYVNASSLPNHITYGPSTTVVPADTDVFVVVNDDVICSSGDAGCQEVGNINWSADRNSTTGADSIYLMNDPDTYGETLCSAGELFCAEWQTDDDGVFYFKDPLDQTCEYRTGVTVNGASYDGWFRSGADEFCYGTCSNNGNACSSDAQCGNGTCNTSDPSYVISGDYSGIWRNGDEDYGGWAGVCDAQNSTCSEFQDPLDIDTDEIYGQADGKKYFYLDNSNLDENSLPASQRCNGKVSLKEGCALFNDTSEPSQGFNASATEIASRHADVFFGSSTFDLVDPIDCESGSSMMTLTDGTQVDLCQQRCVYDRALIEDITDPYATYRTKLSLEETSGNSNLFDADDLFIYGTSCYQKSDCAPMRSQSGEDIEAGACETTAPQNPVSLGSDRIDIPRLENDTNTVLKVNRDRQCSEWLTCADAQEVWDPRTNSYRTVCGDIELCTEYSSVGGDAFCSKWKFNEPEVLLTEDVYTARDVSWYGTEYSGFSIPEIYPVQTLTQANVAPPGNYCDLSQALLNGDATQAEYDAKHGEPCTSGYSCVLTSSPVEGMCPQGDEQDYRLVLNAGSCDGLQGEACSVGYCENTGAACSTSDECGADGGSCVVGICQTDTGIACTSDSQCSGDATCIGGTCVEYEDELTIEEFDADRVTPCPTGQQFNDHENFKFGSCIREQCLLTPEGDRFDPALAEAKMCRGNPEASSPFPEDMVEQWIEPPSENPTTLVPTTPVPSDSSSGWDGIPYDLRSGFENANFCAQGEECACTYKKVTFNAGSIRYFNRSYDLLGSDNPGMCSSGRVGAMCSTNGDCDYQGIEGTCDFPTREDVLLGFEGYCLEEDSGININGDTAQQACLTWLPVDQLAGSTDLYAKYTEAGYFTDTYACSFTSPFANLMMSDHGDLGVEGAYNSIACADLGGAVGAKEADDSSALNTCADNVECPAGYWAMMSMPHFDNQGMETMADACTYGGLRNNDCAYVCIPLGATLDTEDEPLSCDPDDDYVREKLDEFVTGDDWGLEAQSNSGVDVRVIANPVSGKSADATTDKGIYQEFDEMVDALKECSLKGVEVTDSLRDDILNFPSTDGSTYETLYQNAEFYPACEEVLRLVDGNTQAGYPWTDRLLGPSPEYVVSSTVSGLDFTKLTTPTPAGYGMIGQNPNSLPDEWPLVVATCEEPGTDDLHQPFGSAPDFNACAGVEEDYDSGGFNNTEPPSDELRVKANPATAWARSLVGFLYESFGRDDPDAGWNTDPASASSATVFAIINQLFASADLPAVSENKYKWNSADDEWPNEVSDRTYETGDVDSFGTVYSGFDVRAEEGAPPTVWSVNTSNCVTGTECEEDEPNQITLNDQNTGDQSAFSYFSAYVKFYAAADKEQLPIRRVIVDWGDQANTTDDMTGSSAADNMYKNHRGIDTVANKSKCELGNEWGLTSESCDPNYFSYSHIYTCSSEVLTDDARSCQYDDEGNLVNGPCWITNGPNEGDRACAFQPRVHIRDNWGWCTGECTADASSDGCFEGESYDTLNVPTAGASECGYKIERGAGGTIDPWVYYDGIVIVDPDLE